MKLTLSTERYEYWQKGSRKLRKCLISGKWQIKRETGWVTMKKLGI